MMLRSPLLVSIVIRSMDRPTLAEALDSIALQTYDNIEVLVVNARGGVHSPLGANCGRFPLCIVNQGGSALVRAAAANAGLDACRGEYVGFLDDDDTFDPIHVAQLVAALQKTIGDTVVYAAVRSMVRGDLEQKSPRVFAEPFEEKVKLMAGNFIPIHAPLFPRRLTGGDVRFDETLELYEDWDFWLQLAQRARFIFINQVSATYFAGGDSGVSPLGPDMALVERAGNALYEKWRSRITADELKYMSRLFLRCKEIANEKDRIVVERDTVELARQTLSVERDALLAVRDVVTTERDIVTVERDAMTAERDALIQANAEYARVLASIFASTSWRLTIPLRWSMRAFRRAMGFLKALPSIGLKLLERGRTLLNFTGFVIARGRGWKDHYGRWPRLNELPLLIRRGVSHYHQINTPTPTGLPTGFVMPVPLAPYERWLAINAWGPRSEAHLRERIAACSGHLPKLSVVLPVYRPPLRFLELAIDSVLRQVYPNWELCIADDASGDPDLLRRLQDYVAQDARIKLIVLERNLNISGATNAAAKIATGEFLVFLDNDDELTPDALAEVALHVAALPDTDYLYTDDDKISADGRRFSPQFKPDWSPELLLSYMYCGHLVAVRHSLFVALAGMRLGYEGAQDYDFALRATEAARRVGHIPRVLYHWRVLPGSTAASGDAKPAGFEAGRRAVQEALDRRTTGAVAYRPAWAEQGHLGLFWHDFPDNGPTVAILIPTKNQGQLLANCLRSLVKTSYQNFRVIIVDNCSDDAETLDYLAHCGHEVLRIANPGERFSFAYINNEAAKHSDADYLLFLNNDTEVQEPRWLSRMVGYAQITGVGAVGARLLFPDRRIQHAGIVHGLYHGMAGPAFKLAPAHDFGYLSYAMVTRNFSAVTAACMLTPRPLFLSLGGFDEESFAVAYNDVDYCYRLVDSGLRCVYSPGSELLHHEGYSRGFADNPSEEASFRSKYLGRADPSYSPHLTLENERFGLMPRRVTLGEQPPVRTLMVGFNLNLEGAPHSQYELTVALKKLGIIDPVVYCPEDGPLRRLYEQAGIPVHVFQHPLAGVFTGNEYEVALESFINFLDDTGAELVYGNTLQTFYAIAAAEKAGLPCIWNVRESEPWETYFNYFGDEVASAALACFHYPYRVIFVADATRQLYTALETHHNFTVIHNGLDPERIVASAAQWARVQARASLGIGEDEVVFLLLGTVCERKGQHDLALAASRLPPHLHQQARFLVVGDRPGDYSDQLGELVAALPPALRQHFALIPETDEVARYYSAADVFVCSSRLESYPRVILEAMAYGLPIITTPVNGIREQVRPQVNGLFYEPGQINELAAAMETLITHTDTRQRLADNAAPVLATLSRFDEMVGAYAAIFREAYFAKECP